MTQNFDNLYSLDVEADGPCSGLYSMLSFGLVPVGAPERAFYTTLAPISDNYVAEALAVNKWTREETLAFTPAAAAMAKFKEWLDQEPGSGRRVIWSDNPGFDWQFFNYYCHAFLGGNAFGHSARRIGDFNAGLEGNARETSAWRKFRTEAHTHNALEDARGNAGALRHLLSKPQRVRMPRATAVSYALDDVKLGIRLEAAPQKDGKMLWAVRTQFGECLNQHSQWEEEPSPSNRDENFFRRCRWPAEEAAYKAWTRSLQQKKTPKPSS